MDFQQMDKQKFQLNIVLMRKAVEMKFWGCPKITINFLLPVRLSARQASRYYTRPYTARKRAGCKNATEVKPTFEHHRGFRLFLSRPKGRGIKPNRIKG